LQTDFEQGMLSIFDDRKATNVTHCYMSMLANCLQKYDKAWYVIL